MGVFSQVLDVSDAPRAVSAPTSEIPAAPRRLRPGQRRVREPWQAPAGGVASRTSPFAPVRGVTLELFADIARAVAAQYNSGTRGTELAAACGVSATDWLIASRTWNNRIAEHPAVAKKLTELYRTDPADAPGSRAS